MTTRTREKHRIYEQAYRDRHKAACNARKRAHYAANKELYKAKYQQNAEKERAAQRVYRNKNLEKERARCVERGRAIRELVGKIKIHYGCMNPACKSPRDLPPYCLDYHHVDATKKEFNVGASLNSRARIGAEINKCTVLCVICHRMETWGELDATAFPKCHVDSNCIPIT